MTQISSLQNHFLIAMPTLNDPYFERSLMYVCEHNADGAMGLVINSPTQMTLKQLLEQADKDAQVEQDKAEQIILAGGPVSQERGFILHSPQSGWSSSILLSDDIMVTTSKDILGVLGNQHGPKRSLVTLGYAGWTAGQLEQELQDNAWLTVEADTHILFETPIHQRWQAAVNKLGVDVWQLAPDSGHA